MVMEYLGEKFQLKIMIKDAIGIAIRMWFAVVLFGAAYAGGWLPDVAGKPYNLSYDEFYIVYRLYLVLGAICIVFRAVTGKYTVRIYKVNILKNCGQAVELNEEE